MGRNSPKKQGRRPLVYVGGWGNGLRLTRGKGRGEQYRISSRERVDSICVKEQAWARGGGKKTWRGRTSVRTRMQKGNSREGGARSDEANVLAERNDKWEEN